MNVLRSKRAVLTLGKTSFIITFVATTYLCKWIVKIGCPPYDRSSWRSTRHRATSIYSIDELGRSWKELIQKNKNSWKEYGIQNNDKTYKYKSCESIKKSNKLFVLHPLIVLDIYTTQLGIDW